MSVVLQSSRGDVQGFLLTRAGDIDTHHLPYVVLHGRENPRGKNIDELRRDESDGRPSGPISEAELIREPCKEELGGVFCIL